MKKIKMLRTVSGAPDGLNVFLYEEGKVYPNPAVDLSEKLYDVFVNQIEAAEDYEPPAALVKHQMKSAGAAPQNKVIESAPQNKVEKKLSEDDFDELGAGQVRALAEKHGVDLSDKPMNTSAKRLVEVFLERQ